HRRQPVPQRAAHSMVHHRADRRHLPARACGRHRCGEDRRREGAGALADRRSPGPLHALLPRPTDRGDRGRAGNLTGRGQRSHLPRVPQAAPGSPGEGPVMTKLRDDVRGAFDREQTALGDVGDARHRLVHNALAASDVPVSRGLQWAAAIAAMLIAVIVIATFAIARANSHSNVLPAATPTPKAVVSPTPLSNTLTVPDATPIITFGDPAKPDQIDGIT